MFLVQDKTGAVIYYEQLGKIDDEELRKVGLDSKQMLWHYMYQARPSLMVVLILAHEQSSPFVTGQAPISSGIGRIPQEKKITTGIFGDLSYTA